MLIALLPYAGCACWEMGDDTGVRVVMSNVHGVVNDAGAVVLTAVVTALARADFLYCFIAPAHWVRCISGTARQADLCGAARAQPSLAADFCAQQRLCRINPAGVVSRQTWRGIYLIVLEDQSPQK